MIPRFVSAFALALAAAPCALAAAACGSGDRTVPEPASPTASTTRTTSVTVERPLDPLTDPDPSPTMPPPPSVTPPPPPSEDVAPLPPPPDATKLTAEIRRELAHDKRLSVPARGVQVTAVGGKVTLRGTVNTPEERALVERHATRTAGVTSVNNEIVVK